MHQMPIRSALRRARAGRGTILAVVLLFIALMLPVTLILLNTIQIETLLPANENLRLLALHEADKGFDAALNLLMDDSDEGISINVDVLVDDQGTADPADDIRVQLTAPGIVNPAAEFPVDAVPVFGQWLGAVPFVGWQANSFDDTYFVPFLNRNEHDLDYLAEPWARHPGNDNFYLAARSIENRPDPANRDENGDVPALDEEDYAVPERWVLPNIPIGMDDFSERVTGFDIDGDTHEVLATSTEQRPGGVRTSNIAVPFPVDRPVPVGGGTTVGQPEGLPLGYSDNWAISQADPDYALADNAPQVAPRPASYFRNNAGQDATVPDTMTYDAFGDNIGAPDTTQYLEYPPLQQLVRSAGWANIFFGSAPLNSSDRSNFEYKPAPGSITRYQVGSASGSQTMPGWYQAIVSDESGRFPINRLLNLIFQGDNTVYGDVEVVDPAGNRTITATPEVPASAPDQFDSRGNAIDLMDNDEHPNHYNYLMARDILASFFLDDVTMRGIDDGTLVLDTEMEKAQAKANYVIRQMLYKRADLDARYDRDQDGLTTGAAELPNYVYKDGTVLVDRLYSGDGRMGDGQHPMRQGTWQVFDHPLDILADYEAAGQFSNLTVINDVAFLRPTLADFARLHQLVTVYSYDTEYVADQESSIGPGIISVPGLQQRLNFNRIDPNDFNPDSLFGDFSTFRQVSAEIGNHRARALFRWRDGLVDLNGDGDLDDEFIQQPIADLSLVGLEDEPVTQITYRERNHPHFMDPNTPQADMYPEYLNIANIGDLLAVPYNEPEELLYATRIPAFSSGLPTQLEKLDPDPSAGPPTPPALVPGTDDVTNGDLDPAGGTTAFYFTDLPEFNQYDLGNGTILNQDILGGIDGTHPSMAPSTSLIFPAGSKPFIFQMNAGTESTEPELVIGDANTGALFTEPPSTAPYPAVPRNGLNLPGFTSTTGGSIASDLSGPDWSPQLSTRVAYSLGDGIILDDASPTFPPPMLFDGNLYQYDVAFGVPAATRITSFNSPDEGAFYPDWHPSGELIAFTHVENTGGFPEFKVGVWDIEANGMFSDATVDPVAVGPIIRLIIPFQPVWSPKGDKIAFAGFHIDIDLTDPFNPTVEAENSDIYVATRPGDATYTLGTNLFNVTNTDNDVDWWPLYGNGVSQPTTLTLSGQPGPPITFPAGGFDPTDATDRLAIAGLLSVSGMVMLDNVSPSTRPDRLWTARDLPTVPRHMAEPIASLADQLCFREPRSTVDQYGGLRLQAYPGNININTAPKAVLRALLLLMFQGARVDFQAGPGSEASSTPRVEDGSFGRYLTLPDPATTQLDRFNALKIADQYALQIEQYRKWIYNNQFLISDDTVPNGQGESVDELRPVSYRANPNYPYDTDLNLTTQDRQSVYDPQPPFRNIGELFKVALYFNYDNHFGEASSDVEVRLFEAIEGDEGPDRDAMPTAGTLVGDRTVMTWTWGPIWQGDASSRYNGENAPGQPSTGEILPAYDDEINTASRDATTFELDSDYALQQRYRLFSADDFRAIAPWLSTRSYVYRVESRGTLRVQANQQFGEPVDVSADKFMIVNMGDEAVVNYDSNGPAQNPFTLQTVDYDQGFPIYSSMNTFSEDAMQQLAGPSFTGGLAAEPQTPHTTKRPRPWNVICYQEQPESGVPLTRPSFLPTF